MCRVAVLLLLAISNAYFNPVQRPHSHQVQWAVGGKKGGKAEASAANRLETLGGSHHSAWVQVRDVKGLHDGMKMRQLPNSELVVSQVGLGGLMFGEQLSAAQAKEQLDKATGEYGINLIDTAESFPAPSAPSTSGTSELIIGQWLKEGGSTRRASTVVATKVCGYSDQLTWVRKDGSGTRVNRAQVTEAVDASLKRLGTDYIDLLQIHWPERYVPLYGAADYRYDLERPGEDVVSIQEQLEIMNDLIKAGKIRSFGLSNETPYGITAFATTARLLGLVPPVSTQNAYSLLVRNEFENGVHEACSPALGNVGLLSYSPLSGGVLAGKYLGGIKTSSPDARLRQYVGFMHRYLSVPANEAVKQYAALAESISMPLAPLALAWVYTRPFVTSTLIGVTNMQQLEDNVMALNMPISPEVAKLIDTIYRGFLDPTRGVFEVIDPNLDYIDPSKLPWGAKDQDVDPELDTLISQRLSKY